MVSVPGNLDSCLVSVSSSFTCPPRLVFRQLFGVITFPLFRSQWSLVISLWLRTENPRPEKGFPMVLIVPYLGFGARALWRSPSFYGARGSFLWRSFAVLLCVHRPSFFEARASVLCRSPSLVLEAVLCGVCRPSSEVVLGLPPSFSGARPPSYS